MATSMPVPSTSTSRLHLYFRSLVTLAVLIWPLGLMGQTSASDTVVVQWNVAALQGVRDSRIGPPMVARASAIVHRRPLPNRVTSELPVTRAQSPG
jgi:hypothetical protein